MKRICEVFEDVEFERLQNIKKLTKLSWHDFLMRMCETFEKGLPVEMMKGVESNEAGKT